MKIKWRKDSLFSKWCWESWTGTCNNEVRISSHYIQKNSRCFKDLHIDMLLETPRREYRQNILWNKLYECFLGSVSQGNRNKAKINKWNLINHKLLHNKGNYKQSSKREPMDWEKIFANDATNKDFTSKILKQLT